MYKYKIEYKNKGPVKVVSSVTANNLEEIQKMIENGDLSFSFIEDIQFEDQEGEYTILFEEEVPSVKINPITYINDYPLMNPSGS